jgi:hypothetical protein
MSSRRSRAPKWLTQHYRVGIEPEYMGCLSCVVAARDSNTFFGGDEVDARGCGWRWAAKSGNIDQLG